jgi:hypothetical protein
MAEMVALELHPTLLEPALFMAGAVLDMAQQAERQPLGWAVAVQVRLERPIQVAAAAVEVPMDTTVAPVS